jgi:putative flippase GtrA
VRLSSRVLWFAIAGGTGFLVDAGILSVLVWTGLDARPARLVSFAAALTTTWLVNRSMAFGDRAGPPTVAEFLRYAAASMAAAIVNLGLFMGLVTWGGPFAAWPVLALAIATAISMSLNFLSYLKVVFKPKE